MKNQKLKKALQISAFIAVGTACLYQQLTHNPDLDITIGQSDLVQGDSSDNSIKQALKDSTTDSNTNNDNLSSFGQRIFRL
jgi:hypothetical protein